MHLNNLYYLKLNEKFQDIQILPFESDNITCLTLKIILEHYRSGKQLHFNFQNSKGLIFNLTSQLFIELANDIYINFYDLPKDFRIGDKLKRIKDNQYYEVIGFENNSFTLSQVLRKTKNENQQPIIIPNISYDRLSTWFFKINAGISETTINNYFNFFKNLNNKKLDFPKIYFEKQSVFIAKKSFWDDLTVKNKIPSTYLPNPREERDLRELKSIPALPDCLIYFTPKYEVCHQKLLLQGKNIHTIIVFDTEIDKIPQIFQDKNKFGFNLIILSNNNNLIADSQIPYWNWFKEEVEIINAI